MKGMQAEECADEEAPPESPGHEDEDVKEKGGIERMKQSIRQVVAPRAQAVHLTIGHVGKPRDRMPVGGFRALEGPSEVGPADPGHDMRVLRDIRGLVVGDEAMA